jgi:hypothetical protein
MTPPFTYPVTPHVRRHGPRGYADYESFCPWLRDEFAFRCVFCLLRETWGPAKSLYAVDHFLPVMSRPDLALDYDNLLYGCVPCNLSKGAQQTPDPLVCLVATAVTVSENGALRATTPGAAKLIDELRLNRPQFCEYRKLWNRIFRLAALHDPDILRTLLAYPKDLPDLARLRPPGGNARPDGIRESHFQRRQRGQLPDTY